ncbi:hypothetical protein Mgra_00001941 [Meloidogyne graminicola]|uniref:protein-tyrosine-phosphatase n=1 Tax=Meloidogyne graminicola TaxID=189291 RepID=A0A8T0A0A9_9BILA|nr:hypothetical protein Mgra_00001941 [Meloidogyne graminicola]
MIQDHSSSTTNSSSISTLSGSFSSGNLAYLPPVPIDHCVPSITCSCSIGALDQIRSTEITKLFDHLFLGSQKDALDIELLQRHGITKVINLSQNCPRPSSILDDLNHFLRIPVSDSYSAKLLPHFDSTYQFIENAKIEKEKVLIHCLAGISRSPTVAIAYVMRSKKMTNDEAYNFVKCRRPTISPNFNFLGQLFEYERILRQQNILPFINSPSSSTSIPKTISSSNSSISSNFKLRNEELIKKNVKENQKNNNLQHKFSFPTTIARPRFLLTSKEDFHCFRHSCPSTTTTNTSSKSSLPFSPTNIPSPSTEFSKLDLSLINPCFIKEQQKIKPLLNEIEQKEKEIISNKFSSKTTGIENPIFDLNLINKTKINYLSKFKEATTTTTINYTNLNKKFLKSKKERNKLLKPSFISYLEKEEEEEEEKSFNNKNICSTRDCLIDTEGEELTKFGPSCEIFKLPFDNKNDTIEELNLKKNNKGKKYFSQNSSKFLPNSEIDEVNNEKQQTKFKLYR